MGRIIAIGGGELCKGETYFLDQHIIKLTQKLSPKLLFIPTASEDSQGYIFMIEDYFKGLGCEVESLCLISKKYTPKKIQRMILSADIIYVGGGNIVNMMEEWEYFGVNEYLKEAYEQGVVLAGIGAGAICWFEAGYSDNNSFIPKREWDYTKVKGLGFIPAIYYPKYDELGQKVFDETLKNEWMPGIGLEKRTAFIEIDGEYFVIKSRQENTGYKISCIEGIIQKEELEEGQVLL